MEARAMTADVELLPLPSPLSLTLSVTDRARVYAYARANVLHHTAAQAAEIEALRAERDEWRRFATGNRELWQQQVYKSERLAEALRVIAEPLDCGCKPCHGSCRHDAWEWMQEVAINALLREQEEER